MRLERNAWWWIPSLYFGQGIPYVVVMTLSVVMYKNMDISNTDIALYTSWLYLPWVIKPLWSPFVDILGTRRRWIWVTQLLVGAALAGIAFCIPGSDFLRWTLACFWVLAFASATHDIAADGFYMLATSEQQQAAFVGVRTMFYRIATITGLGVLVMLAGSLQGRTGLPRVELHATAVQEVGPVVGMVPTGAEPPARAGALRIVTLQSALDIATGARPKQEVDSLLATARHWNLAHGFTSPPPHRAAAAEGALARAWAHAVALPLERFLRGHFGAPERPAGSTAGNLGVAHVALSRAPGREVVLTLDLRSGDKGIRLVEGARLRFDDRNWNTPAIVLCQLEPALRAGAAATFEIRSGNVPLSWSVVMGVLALAFLGFGLWHRSVLPRPATDLAGSAERVPHFVQEFLRTFGSFFRKPRIGVLLSFLLLYRFGEAQLVKMVGVFLLEDRALGGLGLTTAQVGLVYGTVGIVALTLGGILGGWLIARHGLRPWLWPMLFAIHLPDAAFIYLAHAQPTQLWLVQLCVALEQFGYGFGFTAYMMYMIHISRGEHQTAHYAICTGFMALSMMIPGMWSGWLQTLIGYPHFFTWVILATIPSFLVTLGLPLEADFGKRAGP